LIVFAFAGDSTMTNVFFDAMFMFSSLVN
jgi:hypothetical protein